MRVAGEGQEEVHSGSSDGRSIVEAVWRQCGGSVEVFTQASVQTLLSDPTLFSPLKLTLSLHAFACMQRHAFA